MSLIRCSRHSREDLAHWETYRSQDEAWGRTSVFRRRCAEAMDAILEFAAQGPCYAGTSWGKDSTVLAHLVWTAQEEHGVEIPLVWVRVEPIAMPECRYVRDAFLGRFPALKYIEQEVWCAQGQGGTWHATGTLERGFEQARATHGASRYLSGIRADESGGRARRMRAYGHTTNRTCAPLGWWRAHDVWAYLHAHDLPIHPAYAMSMGGALDRDRLRVASLTGQRGSGFGRGEWERRYYGHEQFSEIRELL